MVVLVPPVMVVPFCSSLRAHLRKGARRGSNVEPAAGSATPPLVGWRLSWSSSLSNHNDDLLSFLFLGVVVLSEAAEDGMVPLALSLPLVGPHLHVVAPFQGLLVFP